MYKNYEALLDEEIVVLAQEGQEAAMEFLIRKYSPLIWKNAHLYARQNFDGDDLYQEGAMALVRAVQKYKEGTGATFYTYAMHAIRKSVMYTVRNWLQGGGGTTVPVEPSTFFNQAKHSYVQVLEIEEEREPDMVQEVLEENLLTPLEKDCLKLFLKGHRYTAIAETLQVPVKKVGNALDRCRLKMRKRYGISGKNIQKCSQC